MEPIVGLTIEELGPALDFAEDSINYGDSCRLQLCTLDLPSKEDLEQIYADIILSGHHISMPVARVIDGIPTTTFDIEKGSPQWALIIPILVPILTIGLITFGIFKIETITKSLLPILLVVGGVVIITAGLLARPAERVATAYITGGKRELLPSTVPKGKETENLIEKLKFLPQTELVEKVKDLWIKATKWEGVPPESRFVVFSANNPYMKEYHEAIVKLLRFKQFAGGEFKPAAVGKGGTAENPFVSGPGKFFITKTNPSQVKVTRSDRKGEFFIDVGPAAVLPEGRYPSDLASIEEALRNQLHFTKEEAKRVELGIPEEVSDNDPRADVIWSLWENLEAESLPQTVPLSAIPKPFSYRYRRELRKVPSEKLLEAYKKLKAGETTGVDLSERDRAWAISAIREILWERDKLSRVEGTKLTVVCMYCGKYMGDKPGGGVTGETSSICRECWKEKMPGEPYPEDTGVAATIPLTSDELASMPEWQRRERLQHIVATPKQKEALSSLEPYEVIQKYENRNWLIKKDNKSYMVTADGQLIGMEFKAATIEHPKFSPDSPEGERLLDPKLFPKRTEALQKLGTHTILEVHDDGDLIVQAYGKKYVVTTDGDIFVHYTMAEFLKAITGGTQPDVIPSQDNFSTQVIEKDQRVLPFKGIYNNIIVWEGTFPDRVFRVEVWGADVTPKTILETSLISSRAIIGPNVVENHALPYAASQRNEVWWLATIRDRSVEVHIYDIGIFNERAIEDIFNSSEAYIMNGPYHQRLGTEYSPANKQMEEYYQKLAEETPRPEWTRAPRAGRDNYSGWEYPEGTWVVWVTQDMFEKELPPFLNNVYVLPWSYDEMVGLYQRKWKPQAATEPARPTPRPEQVEDLEYVPDSPEYLAQTIDMTGWRQKIDQAFQEATERVKNGG